MVRASEPSSDLGIGCGFLLSRLAFVVVSVVVVVGAGVVSWLPDLRMDCDGAGEDRLYIPWLAH